MRFVDCIIKKRDGLELSTEEINGMVSGYTQGDIPDYQMSAMLMAIYHNQMSPREIGDLTLAMAHSGDMLDLSGIKGIKVDKHSTGGVGDKTTLVLAPMIAAIGVPVAKMSGRGLGHTGGTIDKLESIPGFNTVMSVSEFERQVNSIGIALTGQTGNLAPADKKIYALRDVTGTVESIALIASSIMSKKMASGADCIVLDVKTGDGAFMKNDEDAGRLARMMVDIGRQAGRRTVAVISDMSQPLGFAIGNSLEVVEAVETLKGRGSRELLELCLELGSHMAVLGCACDDVRTARERLMDTITGGSALEKLRQWVGAQGGDTRFIDDYSLLPQASAVVEVKAGCAGHVTHIHTHELGNVVMQLGGGRAKKGDEIDLSVGVVLNKKLGDRVDKGETIATVHANDEKKAEEAALRVAKCVVSGTCAVGVPKLVRDIIY